MFAFYVWEVHLYFDLENNDFCRAYRIGQRRNVKVFRLISLGTVEEMMYLRQIYKQVKVFIIFVFILVS